MNMSNLLGKILHDDEERKKALPHLKESQFENPFEKEILKFLKENPEPSYQLMLQLLGKEIVSYAMELDQRVANQEETLSMKNYMNKR